jgi:hypothetical protein
MEKSDLCPRVPARLVGEGERWSGGAVERWSGGAVERWSGGAVERWSGVEKPYAGICEGLVGNG